ncbi:basic helix-loop-helix (bHLH) DNA-bindingsuperfamily protein [Striga asiatica]|uniref:Basic helix-loop-helix (BHLH) DNA-bindingsuperfamily protein n=1 Tax=Striga asiatica TaxID=4170 RepID=A0A5A7P6S8_STRAF|nr:basic helix-loop-helix (bHLH) DNA-bindingsuperfamily protein [Striga asiatica]
MTLLQVDEVNAVLSDAIKYIEYLEQRVRNLEEFQAAEESTESQINAVNNDPNFPNIKARVCEKNVLLKIQCEKGEGNLGKILGELDKFDLAVVNMEVTPFGSSAIDITITAKMEKQLRLSTRDLLKALNLVLQI